MSSGDLRRLKREGREVIQFVDTKIREMQGIGKNCSEWRNGGNGLGILGAVGITAGIALAPFTGGASAAVVALCGSGLSFLGGTIHSASNYYEMRQESATADDVMSKIKAFLDKLQRLIRIISPGEVEAKSMMNTAFSAVLSLVSQQAPPATAVWLTGAHYALFEHEKPSSYFFPPEKVETTSVFGVEVTTTTVGNMCATVAVLASIYSIFKHLEDSERNTRIRDGKIQTAFVGQLITLRDNLAVLTEADPYKKHQ